MFKLLINILILLKLVLSLAPNEITFLILSQKYNIFINRANKLKNNIKQQSSEWKNVDPPDVYISYEMFDENAGSWAISPILDIIVEDLITIDTKWFILCEDHSQVNLKALINGLENKNYIKEEYFGYPLYDRDATIIHHFAFFENPSSFFYPLFGAGVAFTVPLLVTLSQRIRIGGGHSSKNIINIHSNNDVGLTTDFFIDASHELAKFISQNGNGYNLTALPTLFCDKSTYGCGVYRDNSINNKCTNDIVDLDKIIFAVKTCKKFHNDRLPIILSTWGQHVKHLRLYSDFEDKNLATIDTKIVNTEMGHCEKTLSIFKLLIKEINNNRSLSNVEWIILTDDDTILSISRLRELLTCYNSYDDIYLGERYGYDLLSENGYNYITGGGGIVFNRDLVEELISTCTCPTISSPDDMIIGLCLKQLGIMPIHSTRFHQARPVDYPYEVLQQLLPISFHKFWQINPLDVYYNWLDGQNKEETRTTTYHKIKIVENSLENNSIKNCNNDDKVKNKKLLNKRKLRNHNDL